MSQTAMNEKVISSKKNVMPLKRNVSCEEGNDPAKSEENESDDDGNNISKKLN